ncbi:MAG: NAD(P)-binding domain-containing protein [Ignavibacteriales bacterium]|nr:NAD(P)-binding domain-containing protein [Ignavibacteriales bacterium]
MVKKTMSNKILVTGSSVRQELLEPLVSAGYTIDNPTHLLSESELKNALKSSVAYLLGGDEYASRDTLVTANELKIIAFLGMGYQTFIDVTAAKEFQIPITYTPGTLSNSVAEFTVGLLLNSTRKLFLYASEFALGHSGNEEKQSELSSLHIGIIGLGGIGTKIAEILRKGFGSKVSYYSRNRKPTEENRLGINYLTFEQLTKEVDVIIIMTPSTSETKNLIGMSQISNFKSGTILINTARADIVEPESLVTGLQNGQIGYAAFDGFFENPVEVVQYLKTMIPNKLMITGHIASLTHEARDRMSKMSVQSILNILRTGRDKYIIESLKRPQ